MLLLLLLYVREMRVEMQYPGKRGATYIFLKRTSLYRLMNLNKNTTYISKDTTRSTGRIRILDGERERDQI